MGPLIILLVCLLGFAVWWFFLRAPRPEIPPLSMDENDPLMIEAMQKGRWSTEEFLRLFSARPT